MSKDRLVPTIRSGVALTLIIAGLSKDVGPTQKAPPVMLPNAGTRSIELTPCPPEKEDQPTNSPKSGCSHRTREYCASAISPEGCYGGGPEEVFYQCVRDTKEPCDNRFPEEAATIWVVSHSSIECGTCLGCLEGEEDAPYR